MVDFIYDGENNQIASKVCSEFDKNKKCSKYEDAVPYVKYILPNILKKEVAGPKKVYILKQVLNRLLKRVSDNNGNIMGFNPIAISPEMQGYEKLIDSNTKEICYIAMDGICVTGWYLFMYEKGNGKFYKQCSSFDEKGACKGYGTVKAFDCADLGRIVNVKSCVNKLGGAECEPKKGLAYTYLEDGQLGEEKYCLSYNKKGFCTEFGIGWSFEYPDNALTMGRYCPAYDKEGVCLKYEDEVGDMLVPSIWVPFNRDENINCEERTEYLFDSNFKTYGTKYCIGSYKPPSVQGMSDICIIGNVLGVDNNIELVYSHIPEQEGLVNAIMYYISDGQGHYIDIYYPSRKSINSVSGKNL